jgi:hypothetical protein
MQSVNVWELSGLCGTASVSNNLSTPALSPRGATTLTNEALETELWQYNYSIKVGEIPPQNLSKR